MDGSSHLRDPIGQSAVVGVFPRIVDLEVGSQRIYGDFLVQQLSAIGITITYGSGANLVLVARGYVKRYLHENKLNPDVHLILTNPDLEILSFPDDWTKVSAVVVGSFEERTFWAELGFKVLIVPLDDRFNRTVHTYENQGRFSILYHGNLQHLVELRPELVNGLQEFQEQNDSEIRAVYNIEKLGQWKAPRGLRVEHVQWSRENLVSSATINQVGFSPGLTSFRSKVRRRPLLGNVQRTDLQFKRSSNYGRILVMQQLGIPVIAEGFPSAFSAIPTTDFGEIVFGKSDLLNALYRFQDPEERSRVASLAEKRAVSLLGFYPAVIRLKEFIVSKQEDRP